MILGMRFGLRLDGFRVTGFRITPTAPAVGQGVEAWLFQVGKGRAILVSSIGGGSVLMDAGTGQTTSVTAPSVQRLAAAVGAVTAGPAQVPERIILSHADTDHYNAVRALMTQAGFSRTAVEVAQQQVTGAGAGAWASMSLTAQPDQRVIQVNVSGAGGAVHVSRIVIDNMEITEFRSVAAHQDLLRTGRVTYNRNRTSPVVVVRDLVSGQRMLFTADAQGRQFDEIVNAVGQQAMLRILGAAGHNLKLMEAPHHFGEQSARTPAACSTCSSSPTSPERDPCGWWRRPRRRSRPEARPPTPSWTPPGWRPSASRATRPRQDRCR
jgi:beta-lactamase superfamily II metal-dependent hydrolase